MKEYNLIPQEKRNYCVCSVLQAIFDSHKIKISQDEIASKLTPAEKGFYVDDDKIKLFLKGSGFDYKYYWRNQVVLNEIEFALEEMKNSEGFLTIGHHSYLFLDYNYREVLLIDPKNGEKIKYLEDDLDYKIRNSETQGFFGLLKKL